MNARALLSLASVGAVALTVAVGSYAGRAPGSTAAGTGLGAVHEVRPGTGATPLAPVGAAPTPSAGRRTAGGRVPVLGRSSVACRVVTRAGSPLGDTEVELTRAGRVFRQSRTDAAGRARFEQLEEGTYSIAACVARSSGEPGVTPRRAVELGGDDCVHVELVVDCRGGLEGFVLAETGAAVAGATVILQRAGAPGSAVATTTDEQGFYQWNELVPADYRLRVVLGPGPSTGALASPLPRDVHVDALGVARADLRAERSDAALSGTVLDEDGRPIVALRILCVPRERGALEGTGVGAAVWNDVVARTRTDAAGRFVLEHVPRIGLVVQVDPRELLPDARLGLRTLAGAFPPYAVDAAAGDADLGTFVARRPLRFELHGRVVSYGAPPSRILLDALFADPAGPSKRSPLRVRLPLDANGRFTFGSEQFDRPVVLQLRTPDGRTFERQVDPRPGVAVDGVVLALGSAVRALDAGRP